MMFKLAALLSLFLTVVSGQITINPATLNQCETANISWSGGTAPYYVYVYPNWKDPVTQELSYYDRVFSEEEMSIGWLVSFLAGEELRVNIRGSEDIAIAEDFTQAITVGFGISNACVDPGMAKFTDSALLDDGPTSTGTMSSQPTGNNSTSSMGITRGPISINPSSTRTSTSSSTSSPNAGTIGAALTWTYWWIGFIGSTSLGVILVLV